MKSNIEILPFRRTEINPPARVRQFRLLNRQSPGVREEFLGAFDDKHGFVIDPVYFINPP